MFLETFDSEFSYIDVWFTDQNFNPLEIEDEINVKRYSVQYRDRIFVKSYSCLPFAKNMGENIGKNISKNVSDKNG